MRRKNGRDKSMKIVLAVSGIILGLVLVKFGLMFLVSGGFEGLSVTVPALLAGCVVFGLCASAWTAAWVYQDCKKRGDDAVLWPAVIFFVTPLIGLLIYFLRRQPVKQNCPACGHPVLLTAKYCEECGAHIAMEREMKMERKTHHLNYIAAGAVCMVLMLSCLTGFVVKVVTGNGINTDAASGKRVWNTGVIFMDRSSNTGGVWNLKFKSASDGYIKEARMKITDAETQKLYADISCGTVLDGSSLTLWIVQGDKAQSLDVTDLSEPLEYPLNNFENGKINVRLEINGVKDVESEIYIE